MPRAKRVAGIARALCYMCNGRVYVTLVPRMCMCCYHRAPTNTAQPPPTMRPPRNISFH